MNLANLTLEQKRALPLGKGRARRDPRDLQLVHYLPRTAVPDACSWYGSQTEWGEMLNDTLGDCTCAAVGHAEQVATLNTPDGEVAIPDSLVLSLYENACGYVAGDPSTDQGGVITDVLNYWRKNGLGTHKLWAYASTAPGDIAHVKEAIFTFGTVDIGLQLPVTAQDQVGGVWDVVGNPRTDPNSMPGSWGGHSVVVAEYKANGNLVPITWGAQQEMTPAFWAAYVDESYALLTRAWMERFGVQSKLQLPSMLKALQMVTE
jgi:hypothetical protein